MLSNLSPYSVPGLAGSFPQLAAGFPPIGGQESMNPYGQGLIAQNSFAQNPFAPSPFAQTQSSFGQGPAQQIISTVVQLAQQLYAQSVLTQQLGLTLHQIAQHLAVQNLSRPFGAAVGQQGAYGGFNPQAQLWGGSRPYTIQ
jgi:hypothetical protein